MNVPGLAPSSTVPFQIWCMNSGRLSFISMTLMMMSMGFSIWFPLMSTAWARSCECKHTFKVTVYMKTLHENKIWNNKHTSLHLSSYENNYFHCYFHMKLHYSSKSWVLVRFFSSSLCSPRLHLFSKEPTLKSLWYSDPHILPPM